MRARAEGASEVCAINVYKKFTDLIPNFQLVIKANTQTKESAHEPTTQIPLPAQTISKSLRLSCVFGETVLLHHSSWKVHFQLFS